MNHEDHVRLLRKGIVEPGGVWADFGSGAGAFTLALADLLGTEVLSIRWIRIGVRSKNRRELCGPAFLG